MANKPTESKTVSGRQRQKTPSWLRRPGRWASENRFFTPVVSWLAVQYLKLVYKSNSWIVEPADILDQVTPELPVIVGVWHGQHILLPAIPIGLTASVMISRSLDGEITARVAEHFGSRAIRASGGRNAKHTLSKGALKGFLDMKAALERGENVLQTADIPKGTARRAGRGIITLSQKSGRIILPMAVASSRRWLLPKSWDRTTINLPFGKSAIVVGKALSVPQNADDEMLEALRLELQNELNRVTERAYILTGKPEQKAEAPFNGSKEQGSS
jgi:lysophospholipid acyltransferase (LPLAT)-like uncharacterized protein